MDDELPHGTTQQKIIELTLKKKKSLNVIEKKRAIVGHEVAEKMKRQVEANYEK